MPQLPVDKLQLERAAAWFFDLRDKICAAFEKLEDELTGTYANLPPGRFKRQSWERQPHEQGEQGGGGTMAVMRGRVFEKVGVNVSVVHGTLAPDFRASIPGGLDSGGMFWAAGISLVAHMQSPLVPAVHMNTRHLVTSQAWFGGGADLTPYYGYQEDTDAFHGALKGACDRYDKDYYPKFKKACDEYFFLKHRNESRGVGGIFYDNHSSGNWESDFAFTQDVGRAFLDIYPKIVRKRMNEGWAPAQRLHQLARRGRYVEFNLLYDRGTQFGLKTGGNVEAILMSLPPEVRWP